MRFVDIGLVFLLIMDEHNCNKKLIFPPKTDLIPIFRAIGVKKTNFSGK
jgi:hypothetical protein